MEKITLAEIKNVIDNTDIIDEYFYNYTVYDYTELNYTIVGKTPYRDDLCIAREGTIIISPQILITPENLGYSIEELAEVKNKVIDARILFFNNYKLQFNEYPVKRYKKTMEDVISEINEKYDKLEKKTWTIVKTPDIKLWRLSLIHFISERILKKKNNGGNNRLSNYY